MNDFFSTLKNFQLPFDYALDLLLSILITFARRHKLDAERSSVEKVKNWIHSVKEMIRKVEKTPLNDIRRFFSG